MPTGPLLVLDSASLYYRSYYALPSSMTAPDGRPHNAVRGFLSTVTRLLGQHQPSGLVAAWDADWRPQWRVDLVPSYKAHRVAQAASDTGVAEGSATEDEPEDLGPQVDAIAALLDAMGIARWGVADHEADDVVGSVVTQASGPSVVVTGDRDLVQLVSARTTVQLAVNGGMEKWPLLDPDAARERFGVPADNYVDLAVLRGDPSDGLPGVRGIGAKTAVALVDAFGDLDAILAAATMTPPEKPLTPRLAAALLAAAEEVQKARQVARVVRDLSLPHTDPTLPHGPDLPAEAIAIAEHWGVTRQAREFWSAVASCA